MAGIQGYRVQTNEEKTVGRIAGESEKILIVEFGQWPRKTWRGLPKKFAQIDEGARSVTMDVSKETLAMSPKMKPGTAVDEVAMASWWSLD